MELSNVLNRVTVFRQLVVIALLSSSVFGATDTIPEINLIVNQDSLTWIHRHFRDNHSITGSLEYQDKKWPLVRVRIRGDGSRIYKKKSFKITFPDLPFANGRYVINLNADYEDPTGIHAVLVSRLMRESGQPCFQAQHVRLLVNGTFFGLFTQVENMDSQFLNQHNLDTSGNLYKATYDGACMSHYDIVEKVWEKKTNSGGGMDDLQSLIDTMNSIGDQQYRAFISKKFDYNAMINIIAMNMLVGNHSTYYHNYYLFNDKNGTTKWQMFPWDVDRTFSVYRFDFPFHQSAKAGLADNPFLERALLDSVIRNDILKRLDTLNTTVMKYEYVSSIIDSLADVIKNSIAQDIRDNIDNVNQWSLSIEKDRQYVYKRYLYLKRAISESPKPFRTIISGTPFSGPVTLQWLPSSDTGLVYKVRYSRSPLLPPNSSDSIVGTKGSDVTITKALPAGKYYWNVTASNRFMSMTGYDSYNTFTVVEPQTPADTISDTLEWTNKNILYKIDKTVTINKNGRLTVGPGVTISIAKGACLNVNGGLILQGTESNPVRVSSSVPDGGGIVFENASQTAILDHVIIENQAGGVKRFTPQPAAIAASGSHLKISNLSYRNNLAGISVKKGSIELRGAVFHDGNEGEYLNVVNGTAIVDNCEFYNAKGTDNAIWDCIDFDKVLSGSITRCRIEKADDDGIDIGMGSKDIVIRDVIISGMADKGISVGENSIVHIERTSVSHCNVGIAIKDQSLTTGDFLTLYGCDTAVVVRSRGEASLQNVIFSQSNISHVKQTSDSRASISYSLFDKQMFFGKGNLEGNPLFWAADKGDFRVQSGSPAIDAGGPPSRLESDGTLVDIGAYPYLLSTGMSVVINEIEYQDSPGRETGDWVELFNNSGYRCDVSGWVLKDEKDDHAFVIPKDSYIESYGYLVLCRDLQAFIKIHPLVKNSIGDWDFGLSSTGDEIRLFNASGKLIDQVKYDNAPPWPFIPDTLAATLALNDASNDNAAGSSWHISYKGGTPGKKNGPVSTVISQKKVQHNGMPVHIIGIKKQTILVSLDKNARVSMRLYSLRGQMLANLLQNQSLQTGDHAISAPFDRYAAGVSVLVTEITYQNGKRNVVSLKIAR